MTDLTHDEAWARAVLDEVARPSHDLAALRGYVGAALRVARGELAEIEAFGEGRRGWFVYTEVETGKRYEIPDPGLDPASRRLIAERAAQWAETES